MVKNGRILRIGGPKLSVRSIQLKDADGRPIALRLWKRQLRTLAQGTSGLLGALEGE